MKASWQVRSGYALIAAGAMILNACADTPTAPSAAASLDVAEVGSAASEGVFISNAQKYADGGKKPGIGRAGSAVAAMQALLGKDGRATVDVVAGEEWTGWTRERKMRDDPWGDATLSKVQLKAFDADGKPQFTRNFNELDAQAVTLPANGLLRGGRAQVHANVQGADPARTGMVVIDAPVLLRPDLTVHSLRTPPRAAKNTAVPIVAVVRELNGDVGAWADCVLYVDGVETDRAWGVWVDAGSTVTCTMMHMFRDVGEIRYEVRVEHVAPGDFDAANNMASGSMTVFLVPSAFYFNAAFEDRTWSDSWAYESIWSNANGREGSESSASSESSGRVQQSYLSAMLPRAVRFPITEIFARQSTRDEVAHAVTLRNLPADWGYDDGFTRHACATRQFMQPSIGRVWLQLCTQEPLSPDSPSPPMTVVSYDRFAGDVTYASRNYSRYWHRDLAIDDVYSFNNDWREVTGRFVRYGLEYGFFIRLNDQGVISTVNPLVGLLPFETAYVSPRNCSTWEDPMGSMRWCYESSNRASGVSGVVYGEPSP